MYRYLIQKGYNTTMPIKIETYPDIQQKFFQSLMATSNSLALSQLWLVGIDRKHMEDVNKETSTLLNKFEGATTRWEIFDDAVSTYDSSWFIGDMYYVLAQSVVFPGDGISIIRSGVGQTGALKGLIGENRNDLPNVTIVFHETNQSVADLFFRPWVITLGFKSLKYQQLRKPITLLCFQKDGITSPLKLRKTVILEACAPISVDSEEYNYTAGKVIQRQIEFVYNRYYIQATAGKGICEPELITEYANLASMTNAINPDVQAKPVSEITAAVIDSVNPDFTVFNIDSGLFNNITTPQPTLLTTAQDLLKSASTSYIDTAERSDSIRSSTSSALKSLSNADITGTGTDYVDDSNKSSRQSKTADVNPSHPSSENAQAGTPDINPEQSKESEWNSRNSISQADSPTINEDLGPRITTSEEFDSIDADTKKATSEDVA